MTNKMTRNEILDVAGKFYRPETITEREIAFARYMMKYEREACAMVCDKLASNWHEKHHPLECARQIRARGQA